MPLQCCLWVCKRAALPCKFVLMDSLKLEPFPVSCWPGFKTIRYLHSFSYSLSVTSSVHESPSCRFTLIFYYQNHLWQARVLTFSLHFCICHSVLRLRYAITNQLGYYSLMNSFGLEEATICMCEMWSQKAKFIRKNNHMGVTTDRAVNRLKVYSAIIVNIKLKHYHIANLKETSAL